MVRFSASMETGSFSGVDVVAPVRREFLIDHLG